MEAPKFGPFERCLYCLKSYTDAREPTDEHIVPEYAGGRVFIEDGACISCARHSNSFFETPSSRTTFYPFRVWSGLCKPTARGLGKMALGKVLEINDDAFNVVATLENRPPVFTLLKLDPPTGWADETNYRHDRLAFGFANMLDEVVNIEAGFWFRSDRRDRPVCVVSAWVKSTSYDVTVIEEHDMRGFYLTVAKIAHCFGVATLGLDAYDHTDIRDLLAGRRLDMATFVGGYEGGEDLPRNSLHVLQMRERNGVLAVIVHLYASKFGVAYEVIIGRRHWGKQWAIRHNPITALISFEMR